MKMHFYGWVEERSMQRRSGKGTDRGAHGSEDADISSDKTRENRVRRKPKVSCTRFVQAGLVGS